jgi:hypothetical protein
MNQDNSTRLALESPRVYAASGSWRFFIVLCSVLITGGASAGLGYVLFGTHTNSPGARILLGILSVLFILLGVSGALSVLRSKLILFPDHVRVQGLLTVREFTREELRGWRILSTSPPTLVFQPKDPDAKTAKIGLTFAIDDELSAWLDFIPNLDEIDTEASTDEILKDDRLGLTESERARKFEQERTIARVVSSIGIAASLWAFFYPHPYKPLMFGLIVLPWFAVIVMVRSKGLIRADELRKDPHPSVASALFFPGMALVLRVVLDMDVIESAVVVLLCLALGAALIGAILKSDPTAKNRKTTFAALVLFSLAYAYGAVIETNVLLDRSNPAYYSAAVQAKHVVNGKRVEYKLTLAPWGPKTRPNDLLVRSDTYGSVQVGDIAVLGLRRGALGIRWYYLHDWRHAGEPLN